MDLKVFDGQEKSELSMIEVAHAILAYHNEAMAFADLTNEIQQYLGKSDEEIRERLSQFYTDLNVDGSFISLGDNTWGLRAWYPYESIDEATVGETEDEEDRPKKRRRKVNAFLAGTDDDDDVIDYDNDDPEDEYLDDDQGPDDDDDYEEDDYDEDNPVEDDDEETNIEDQLSELHGDEFGDDEEEDEEDKEDDEE